MGLRLHKIWYFKYMKHVRWYDKDSEVKSFLDFLQNLDEETRKNIAQDLIQIILKETSENTDIKIDYLNNNKPLKYERWYDKDANLHSAIELIKFLDEKNKKEALQKIMESTFQLITEILYANKQ